MRHTEETKKIISECAKRQHAEGRAVVVINEPWVKAKMAITKSGVPLTEAHCVALSAAKIGVPQSDSQVAAFTEAQHKDESGTNAAKLTRKEAWHIKFNLLPSGIDACIIANNYDLHPKSIENIESERSWAFVKEDDYDA